MTASDSMSAIAAEARDWRRHLHQNPELLFDLPQTSGFVAEKLKAFGCDEIVTGIGKTGIVALIKGKNGPGRTIGLRADMDALPIPEQTNLPYASRVEGRMHACGHDGHTTTLLATAKYLAETRDFAGTVALIFQPAEEGGHGALEMIKDGFLDRFGIEEVYGMHNQPGLPVGAFSLRPGPVMAGGDRFILTLTGRGGHAAHPDKTRDPVVAAAHLIAAAQTITSRYVDPFDPVVISITYIKGGNSGALNVIPASVEIGGTIRTMTAETRRDVPKRFADVANATAALFEMAADIKWFPGYPVTVNDPKMTEHATAAAKAVSEHVETNPPRSMGSEDFSYMLEQRPGAFINYGNGDSASLHNPAYDFNDDAILPAMRFFVQIATDRLA